MWYSAEFTVGNETYSVEPVDETLLGEHRVYRESDSVQPTYVCGMFFITPPTFINPLRTLFDFYELVKRRYGA